MKQEVVGMKLWLVTNNQSDDETMYDSFNGHVIRAFNETSARYIASQKYGDEGRDTWLDSQKSKCTQITIAGEEGIILSDFTAG